MGQSVRERATAIAEQVATAWRARRAGSRTPSPPPGGDLESRVEALTARVAHLEVSLEGLQDALYRQSVRTDETHADLLRRTEPERIARELSDDARRRGL